MIDHFEALRRHLHRGGQYGYWWYTSEAKHASGKKQGEAKEKLTVWWPVDRPAPLPREHGSNGPRHIYFGVHPTFAIPERLSQQTGQPIPAQYLRAKLTDVAAINCLFSEFDAKQFKSWVALETKIGQLSPAPSVVISSGGGLHCYWLLYEPFLLGSDDARERARKLQAAWVKRAGSDDDAKDLTRVLRVPGTHNHKAKYGPDYPVVSFEQCDLTRLYDISELAALVTLPQAVAANGSGPGSNSGNHWLDKALARVQPGAENGNGRQATALWLGCQLRDSGMGKAEAERIILSYAQQVPGAGVDFKEGEALHALESAYSRPARAAAQGSGTAAYTNGTSSAREATLEPEPDGSDLSAYSPDDEGNALAVKALYGEQFAYCDAYGWMAWTGRYWNRENAEGHLDRAIVDTLIKRRMAAVLAEREAVVKVSKPNAEKVRSARYLFRSQSTVSVNDFDKSPDLLNVANGVLDLRTGELRPHAPGGYYTYCIDTEYHPKADYSAWVDWLSATVEGGQEVVDYLQLVVGYALTGHTSEEALWYIHGPPRSGKGTFAETLRTLLGTPLSTNVDFGTFTRDRDNDASNFDLAPLKAARLIIASESNKNQHLNPARINAMTGGDDLMCCFKHHDHFTYRPQFKIFLISNHPINGDPDNDALWGRLRVLSFPNSHLGTEDKGLKARMKSPDNLKAVLAWAAEGARRWYQSPGQGLHTPAHVKESTQAARDALDFVQQWLDECTEASGWVTNPVLYASYASWCEANGVPPKKHKGLTQSLRDKGYKPPEVGKVEGKSKRLWEGLSVVKEAAGPPVEKIPF